MFVIFSWIINCSQFSAPTMRTQKAKYSWQYHCHINFKLFSHKCKTCSSISLISLGFEVKNNEIKSITSNLTIVLEPSKAYFKRNLQNKKYAYKWLLDVNAEFLFLSDFWVVLNMSSLLQVSGYLKKLYACNSILEIRKSITEKLFLKTVKASFTCLLRTAAVRWETWV